MTMFLTMNEQRNDNDNVFGIKTKYHRLRCFPVVSRILRIKDVNFWNLFCFVHNRAVKAVFQFNRIVAKPSVFYCAHIISSA